MFLQFVVLNVLLLYLHLNIFLYIILNCVSFKCLQLCDINELTKRDAREEDDSW